MNNDGFSRGLSEGVLAAMRPMLEVEKIINRSMGGIILNQHRLTEEIRRKLEPITAASELAKQMDARLGLNRIMPNYDSLMTRINSSMGIRAFDEIAENLKQSQLYNHHTIVDRTLTSRNYADAFTSAQNELVKLFDLKSNSALNNVFDSWDLDDFITEKNSDLVEPEEVFDKFATVIEEVPYELERQLDRKAIEEGLIQAKSYIQSIPIEQKIIILSLLSSVLLHYIALYTENKSIQSLKSIISLWGDFATIALSIVGASKSKKEEKEYRLLEDTILRAKAHGNSKKKATVEKGASLTIRDQNKSWVLVDTYSDNADPVSGWVHESFINF